MTYADRDALLKSLGYFDYAEYLQSPLWKHIRQSVFIKSAKICRLCNSKADVVHHRSYAEEVLTGEKRDESVLVALCDTCHYAVEFRGKAKRSAQEAEIVFCRLLLNGISNGKKQQVSRHGKKRNKKQRRTFLLRQSVGRDGTRCLQCRGSVKKRLWGKPDRRCNQCQSKMHMGRVV